MPMTPPPVGWSMDTERSRREFAEWLRVEQRSQFLRTATLAIGYVAALFIALLTLLSSSANGEVLIVSTANPQPIAAKASCPASCTCDNCQCEHCDGECAQPSAYVLRDQMIQRIRERNAKEREVYRESFPVAQNCANGMCQLHAARPKPIAVPRPQVYYLPRYSSGGCANGNCSPQRRGLFGRR